MTDDVQVGVGGVHKQVSEIHVGVGGVYKAADEVHVGVGGVWKQVWPLLTASLTGGWAFDTGIDVLTTTTAAEIVTVNISDASSINVTTSGSGTNPLIQKNGTGAYLSSQSCVDGDTLKARLTTGASNNTIYSCIATLTGWGTKTYEAETVS
tara:strand:+ start:220 stop:675 length:456 start_codon:yes stop_codon:yes gene_type:complete